MRLNAADSSLASVLRARHQSPSQTHQCSAFCHFCFWSSSPAKTQSLRNTHINPYFLFPITPMLWKYSLQFTGMIEAGNSLTDARQRLIDRMKADPGAFISKLEPAEPSVKNLVDLGKAVFGLK